MTSVRRGYMSVRVASTSLILFVSLAPSLHAQFFSDDFERADGAVDGWTPNNGVWSLAGGELLAGPPNGPEQECFAGDPALVLPDNYRLSFDIRWIAPDPPGGVGRHAGVMFNFDQVTARGTGTGYLVWWIDRPADRGFNLSRRDSGVFNQIVVGQGPAAPADPPSRWTIEVIGRHLRAFGDGQLFIDHVDDSYRGGRFGFWTWSGEGQTVAFDNVVVEPVLFSDDFDRGAVGGWTTDAGTWEIVNGKLVGGPTVVGGVAGEHQIFAGYPPVALPDDVTISFDVNPVTPSTNATVGRHFGCYFGFDRPGNRYSPVTNGYQVHWIDRAADHGINLVRWDGGTQTTLQQGTGDLFADPPANIRIEVSGPDIRVYGDDVLAVDLADETYRGGHFAPWIWVGEQVVEFDNVSISDGGGEIFFDAFDPRPLSLGNWSTSNGTWEVLDGGDSRLRAGPPPGVEQELFAGAPPILLPDDFSATLDWTTIAPDPPGAIGRHPGVLFCFDQVGPRSIGNGYQAYWIDRAADRGLNLGRWDAGSFNVLVPGPGAAAPADPPSMLSIEVDGDSIRVLADGVLVIDHIDTTYRNGHFGLWTWNGEGQVVDFDNVEIIGVPVAVNACFEVASAEPHFPGTPVDFDASCTFGNATAFQWDFGDGESGEGEAVTHSYAQGGTYMVTLTAEGPNGVDSVSQNIEIATIIERDCNGMISDLIPGVSFDAGIDGWTVVGGGQWQGLNGQAVAGPSAGGGTAGEQQLFLGAGPVALPDLDQLISFDWNFLAPANNPGGVGRHAGCYFAWTVPGNRYAANTSGYQVHWIDRASDRGFNLLRWDGAGVVALQTGTGNLFAGPPANVRIEIEGDRIRVFGDDVLAIDVVDSTYRGGYVGLWTWDGEGQNVEFDNVCVGSESLPPPVACFVQSSPLPNLPVTEITFDAGCSTAFTGDIESFSWDFGDGNTLSGVDAVVSHSFDFTDTYTVTLSVEAQGQMGSVSVPILVSPGVLGFSDDFERADGPIDGWTVASGASWALSGNQLAAGPTTEEYWIWAGDPPVIAAPNFVAEFDWSFLAPGSNATVGRHGGFQFHCDRPTTRSEFSGYVIDWIDRAADRGVRLTRVDSGGFVGLATGQGVDAPADPPQHYRVEVQGDRIRVFGDDVLYIDVADTTYRGGYSGFWTWSGDQQVAIDSFELEANALIPCFTTDTPFVQPGSAVTFDASCSSVFADLSTIAKHEWDFGDGSGVEEGVAIQHSYGFADVYTVTLTVTDADDRTAFIERTLSVAPDLVPFSDCFEREPGPLQGDGWSINLGDWSINGDERAETVSGTGAPDAEAWLWAGSPPRAATGDMTLQFDAPSVVFDGDPADVVGRHFGIMFYASAVTTNRTSPDSNGYGLWWIDREADRGLNLTRLDGTQRTILAAGALGDLLIDPPTTWRVEVEGPSIRVYADDNLAIDVEDGTYRSGYTGFWVWKNMSVQIDTVAVGPSGVEPPGCPSAGPSFRRGDTDGSGLIDISDPIYNLTVQFVGGAAFGCRDAADVDNSGVIDISDPIYNLQWQFVGGIAPPPAPGPQTCGLDPDEDALDCAAYPEEKC